MQENKLNQKVKSGKRPFVCHGYKKSFTKPRNLKLPLCTYENHIHAMYSSRLFPQDSQLKAHLKYYTFNAF